MNTRKKTTAAFKLIFDLQNFGFQIRSGTSFSYRSSSNIKMTARALWLIDSRSGARTYHTNKIKTHLHHYNIDKLFFNECRNFPACHDLHSFIAYFIIEILLL